MTILEKLKRCGGPMPLTIVHIDGVAWATDGCAIVRLPEIVPECGDCIGKSVAAVLKMCNLEGLAVAKRGALLNLSKIGLLRGMKVGETVHYVQERYARFLDGEIYVRSEEDRPAQWAQIFSVLAGKIMAAVMGVAVGGNALAPIASTEAEELEYYRERVLYGGSGETPGVKRG